MKPEMNTGTMTTKLDLKLLAEAHGMSIPFTHEGEDYIPLDYRKPTLGDLYFYAKDIVKATSGGYGGPYLIVQREVKCDCAQALEPRCRAYNGKYYCTRPAGHSGDHVACRIHSKDGHNSASWPQQESPADTSPQQACPLQDLILRIEDKDKVKQGANKERIEELLCRAYELYASITGTI